MLHLSARLLSEPELAGACGLDDAARGKKSIVTDPRLLYIGSGVGSPTSRDITRKEKTLPALVPSDSILPREERRPRVQERVGGALIFARYAASRPCHIRPQGNKN